MFDEISKYANVNQNDRCGKSPVFTSWQSGPDLILSKLIDGGASVYEGGNLGILSMFVTVLKTYTHTLGYFQGMLCRHCESILSF